MAVLPQWEEILEYARWAPSPHNVQPWKIKLLTDNKAEVYYLPERLLPVEDPSGCFNSVGFGLFIEMLSVAAAPGGFKVKEELTGSHLDASKKSPTLFATLTLVPITFKETLDRELIKKRKTSRLRYDGRQVDEKVVRTLQEIAQEYEQTFSMSTDVSMVDWVLQLNKDTVFYDMDEKAPREEIASWLRYSVSEAEAKKDGLWSYCMRYPGFLMYLFFHARWLFNTPLLKQIVEYSYLYSTQGTKTVGWLSGPFDNEKDWVNAGRMFARLWLTMTQEKVVLHPFGSIITNHRAHARLQKKFGIKEGGEKVWLLVRMGYSNEPPRSKRRNPHDIILQE